MIILRQKNYADPTKTQVFRKDGYTVSTTPFKNSIYHTTIRPNGTISSSIISNGSGLLVAQPGLSMARVKKHIKSKV